MISEIFEIMGQTLAHFYTWMNAIQFSGVSAWSIFIGSFAVGLIFKGLHSMFFNKEDSE